ncbi:MAG TPA: phosphoribosylglycinamide formyltransferase [Acidobacteriota bacterium]|nr:phosphoribosylglycinamide formyltransferase [Acidobacteriota bacterium]
MKNVAILLSGRGSNFMAISDAIEAGEIPARIVLVFSNKPEAPGLAEARRRGYPASSISPQKDQSRQDYDRLVAAELEKAQTDIICLAGYMRIVSPYFVGRFPHRILNIHPSLLPAFPGLKAQQQALEWGAKVSGCTVHFVDEKLDHGPAILQQAVPVKDDDTEESLSARILVQEHRLYPEALRIVCQDRHRIEGRRVLIAPGT